MEADPLWYKTAIVYQLHVRSFCDSNGDGIGDFRGLTEKLDYLQDLGVTAVWLLPFYPSPLKDDGYDIADYRNIHPDYGTLSDFREFLREAHRRGLRVITELVLNHTSDQHPWFQRARRAPPGSPERDYYVWSDTSDKYSQARVIFQDYEASNWSWDPVARAYYWHRFFHHQPDLNYDNPLVQQELASILDHWCYLGVDGLRLDGVPYLFQREGTTCESLPETHDFLKQLRAHVDSKFSGRMFLAEANQWPEDTLPYFGDGDECHTAFHFPLMPRMYLALQMEDRFPIIDILDQTPPIPDNCQWMLFLRNHDELTLEMVTEEERDVMYRFYARDPQARLNLGIRRRLAPLLENDRRKIELLNGLLLSLPGTPIIYYGDELGMGDNIYLGDRNGVRTPMQWSADRNAGFSRANPQRLYLPPIIDYQYHYESMNVETQRTNPNSLLQWMQRIIRLRREVRPLAEGDLEFLHPANSKVLAYVRRLQDECVLVVANLSHTAQFVELDLAAHEGKTPVELSGRTRFPRIGELPYLLTMMPYAFYWFILQPESHEAQSWESRFELPTLETQETWTKVLETPAREELQRALPGYLVSRVWHRRPGVPLRRVTIRDHVPFVRSEAGTEVELLLVRAEYQDSVDATYLIPLAFAAESEAVRTGVDFAEITIARLSVEHNGMSETGILYDAFGQPEFCREFLDSVAARRETETAQGRLIARPTSAFERIRGDADQTLQPGQRQEKQSNSVVPLADQFILKWFRRLEEGIHPELEIGLHLTESASFPLVAPVAGAIEYQPRGGRPMTVGLLQGFVEHRRTAWEEALDMLEAYIRAVSVDPPLDPPADLAAEHRPFLRLKDTPVPEDARRFFGGYLQSAVRLGQRTAELHQALAMNEDDPALRPEPLLPFHQRGLYQSIRNVLGRSFRTLRQLLPELPEDLQKMAGKVLECGGDRLTAMRQALPQDLKATRIRCHGNFGLPDVLCHADDVVIVDFEGDPDLSISQRRAKASPLRDVAGMLWSFERAGMCALRDYCAVTEVDGPEMCRLAKWIDYWLAWTGAEFLRSYLATLGDSPLIPHPPRALQTLLDLYYAERSANALEHDLKNRSPDLGLSLKQAKRLLEESVEPGE
ncbi:MAG: maltose alpha-D-glucosyltransferase [Planctomycetaceae bacterium]|nr:MAG: maltose alpha-D-glucosyltransferase [Planctomycetaceae bacterium]